MLFRSITNVISKLFHILSLSNIFVLSAIFSKYTLLSYYGNLKNTYNHESQQNCLSLCQYRIIISIYGYKLIMKGYDFLVNIIQCMMAPHANDYKNSSSWGSSTQCNITALQPTYKTYLSQQILEMSIYFILCLIHLQLHNYNVSQIN